MSSLVEHDAVHTPVPLAPPVRRADEPAWILPSVLLASLAAHGVILAAFALLPTPTYAIRPTTTELSFEVMAPPAVPAPEPPPPPAPVVEPPPPVAAAAAPPRAPRVVEPEAAPPPPAPILTATAAQPTGWSHPEGEAGGQLGGTPGGTGDTPFAEPGPPPVAAAAPAPRTGMSRTELRRRLVEYIRSTLHGYVNSRIEMPLVARRERLEGVVIVRIRLSESGSVLGVRLSRSSGHPVLDEAAVASLRAITEVPAPPEDLPWDADEELPLPVRYQLQ